MTVADHAFYCSFPYRAIGQMLIMGWDGTEVTPQIRNLIENHHLGSILLTAKNLKCLSYRLSPCTPHVT